MYEGALFVSGSTTNMWMHTLSPPFALLLVLVISAHNSPVYSVAALDLSPAASPSSAINNTSVTRGFAKPYQKLTILISTLFIAFLFLGFCAHYVTLRSCFNRRNSASRNSDFLAGLQPITNGPHRGEEEERGLESWLVKSLPVVKYTAKKDEQELEGGAATTAATAARIGEKVQVIKLQECAVCLSEYEEGEEMKELPMCGHRFHNACIDMWLFSHSTCPICRLSLRKHFKAAHKKSSTNQPASLRSPDSAPLPRASHVELTMPSDPPFASTSSGYRDSLVNSHDDVSTDEAEDARDSSAALHPHFLSSA